jgi:membrane protein YdbS with pleckstrin-like domain
VRPEPGEEVLFHGHPSWRAFLGLYAKGLALTVLAGALAGVISAAAAHRVQDIAVVLVVLAGFVVVIGAGLIAQLRTTYTVTSRRLAIDVGVLARSLHQTRLERIQNVRSWQSPLERVLMIGTVGFDTAGEAGFDFSFHGVARPREIAREVDRALGRLPRSYV